MAALRVETAGLCYGVLTTPTPVATTTVMLVTTILLEVLQVRLAERVPLVSLVP